MSAPWRRFLFFTGGRAPVDAWLRALAEELPLSGEPKACARCPLRVGGEWEAGARAALAEMSAADRAEFGRSWGCHESDRPCAGARRLATEVQS